MKNINLLLLAIITLIFVQNSACNEKLLSKFRQHTYKLKDVRIELMSYNKDYINFFEIKPFKYNRTTTAHNVTINIKVDLEDTAEVVVEAYKFLSNEYRKFGVHFQLNAQKGFESNAMGLRAITKCGNVTSFRLYKDITYHACNFVIDESQFPPLVPNGKYKLELTILILNTEVAVINIYNEVAIVEDNLSQNFIWVSIAETAEASIRSDSSKQIFSNILANL